MDVLKYPFDSAGVAGALIRVGGCPICSPASNALPVPDWTSGLVCGGQGVMFVQDAPASMVLAESHREAELEVGFFAVMLDIHAPPNCRRKGRVLPSGDLTSSRSNTTGFGEDAKNICHVAMYASSPRDKNGGGTSKHQKCWCRGRLECPQDLARVQLWTSERAISSLSSSSSGSRLSFFPGGRHLSLVLSLDFARK